MNRCEVTHGPGGTYICWSHRRYRSWSTESPPLSWSGCWCDHHGYTAPTKDGER